MWTIDVPMTRQLSETVIAILLERLHLLEFGRSEPHL